MAKRDMKFIGVTGTNGKTTTTWLVRSILQEAGYRCAAIGTLSGKLTTPSPWHLKRTIRRYRHMAYDWIVMEVSSHGIHQNRIKGIKYDVKALTNITQDHLDYHKTMEEYRKVKLDWFFKGDCVRVTLWPEIDRHIEERHRGTEAQRHKGNGDYLKESFYEQNRDLAAEICRRIGISEDIINRGLKNAPQVPGRFEYIHAGQPFDVVVDFAHTPDGLEKILKEARLTIKNKQGARLIALFGCGGDRDRTKRPKMGKLAYDLADVVVVTSDNPRSEEPGAIVEEIMTGIPMQGRPPVAAQGKQVIREVDRPKAVKMALEMAKPGDCVVLAGKGHETYQIFKDKTIHYSDKEEVLKNLKTVVSSRHNYP
ncbi:MAG: UDP-N-acetylmuramoyl-L-alanyl-D-glutamate--2,6-diaminopimelate ligase [Candidatus Margulisiibacteriota bacterium]|jgi:UDP-N-acetylmuramyl tripeptide synthase